MDRPNLKRSILAVLAGLVFTVVSHSAVDALLHAVGYFPPAGSEPMTDAMALVATLYRTALTVAAAFLTAWLAPRRPVKHALVLGAIGAVLGTAGAIATVPMNVGPAWYPVALAVLALPECWLGGWLYARRNVTAGGTAAVAATGPTR